MWPVCFCDENVLWAEREAPRAVPRWPGAWLDNCQLRHTQYTVVRTPPPHYTTTERPYGVAVPRGRRMV